MVRFPVPDRTCRNHAQAGEKEWCHTLLRDHFPPEPLEKWSVSFNYMALSHPPGFVLTCESIAVNQAKKRSNGRTFARKANISAGYLTTRRPTQSYVAFFIRYWECRTTEGALLQAEQAAYVRYLSFVSCYRALVFFRQYFFPDFSKSSACVTRTAATTAPFVSNSFTERAAREIRCPVAGLTGCDSHPPPLPPLRLSKKVCQVTVIHTLLACCPRRLPLSIFFSLTHLKVFFLNPAFVDALLPHELHP